jgi:hypothetical protein
MAVNSEREIVRSSSPIIRLDRTPVFTARVYLEGLTGLAEESIYNPIQQRKQDLTVRFLQTMVELHAQQSQEDNPNLSDDPAEILARGNHVINPDGTSRPIVRRIFRAPAPNDPNQVVEMPFDIPIHPVYNFFIRQSRHDYRQKDFLAKSLVIAAAVGMSDFTRSHELFGEVSRYEAYGFWKTDTSSDHELNMEQAIWLLDGPPVLILR